MPRRARLDYLEPNEDYQWRPEGWRQAELSQEDRSKVIQDVERLDRIFLWHPGAASPAVVKKVLNKWNAIDDSKKKRHSR